MTLPTVSTVVWETFGEHNAAQDIGWTAATGASATGFFRWHVNEFHVQYLWANYNIDGVLLLCCRVPHLCSLRFIALQKTAQEGPRGPTGLGTIATFVLAGVLFSVAPSVGTLTETLFGGRDSMTEVSFLALSATMGATGSAHAENVVVSVLAFLIIVGILSIIRGFFVLRGVAEGNQQMTMMGGVSHVIAGAILVNFGQFANIIQNTLGISGFGVLFN